MQIKHHRPFSAYLSSSLTGATFPFCSFLCRGHRNHLPSISTVICYHDNGTQLPCESHVLSDRLQKGFATCRDKDQAEPVDTSSENICSHLRKTDLRFKKINICVCVCLCVHVSTRLASNCRHLKRALHQMPLELELQVGCEPLDTRTGKQVWVL